MAHLERRSHLKRSPPVNKTDKLPEDKITPEHLYVSRRKFIVGVGAVAATAFLAACTRQTPGIPNTPPRRSVMMPELPTPLMSWAMS